MVKESLVVWKFVEDRRLWFRSWNEVRVCSKRVNIYLYLVIHVNLGL